MGEDPRVRGLFHGVGFNSAGMMLGGGCGDQLAKWVVRGRPELDMYGYDMRRFCPAVSQNTNWPRVLPGLDRDSLERGGQHLEYRARAASTYWPPSS